MEPERPCKKTATHETREFSPGTEFADHIVTCEECKKSVFDLCEQGKVLLEKALHCA
jgi:hypothetical protein